MSVDICLISPAGRAAEPRLPLALMYLCSWLEQQGNTVKIIDVKSDPYQKLTDSIRRKLERKILREVEEIEPLVVGITCLTPEVMEVRDLSREIKKRLPKTQIVVGGVHPTLYPEDFLYSKSPTDFVAIGEGEETLGELVATLKKKGDWRNIRGLAWFEDGKLRKNSPRHLIEDLDQIPFPAYHQVDMDYYTTPTIYCIRHMLISAVHIFTTRGCPEQCTFCVNKNLWGSNESTRRVRFRSPNRVVDELEFLSKNYHIDGFYIYDDTFTINKKHVLGFCDEFSKRGLDLVWGAETRVNLVSPDMLEAMKKAGCLQIDFGVETGSQEILDRMKKGITLRQVQEAFGNCRRLGLRSYASFMFNTPGETEEDVRKAITLAKEIDATGYNFNILTPFPGTDLYEKEVEPKLTVDEYAIYWGALGTLRDPRFKFCEHNLDLHWLVTSTHTLFNSVKKRAVFLLDRRYLTRLTKSRRKKQYLFVLLRLLVVTARYSLRYIRFALARLFWRRSEEHA